MRNWEGNEEAKKKKHGSLRSPSSSLSLVIRLLLLDSDMSPFLSFCYLFNYILN